MQAYGLLIAATIILSNCAFAGTKTWDGVHATEQIELTVVYFVPADRQPLADWRDRVDDYCQRIEKFHHREFGSQSQLTTKIIASPHISSQTTKDLRKGDANAIFYKTLSETDLAIEFQSNRQEGVFPILLVLSEINWRPLDDFYRLRPDSQGFEFEGNYHRGQHFPGAASGGARASYLSDRGCGWGLVSADGWRVPYRGSDCVVYHEGVGHTVGLPHPEKANGSVMSMGQYQGWLSESWINSPQKEKLQWQAKVGRPNLNHDLFSTFRAIPVPLVPKPNQEINLKLDWPMEAKVKQVRLRYQTALDGPWSEVPQIWNGPSPKKLRLGQFDRDTPISYRIEVELDSGETEELWGYLQVRGNPNQPAYPESPSIELQKTSGESSTSLTSVDRSKTLDLLERLELNGSWKVGEWKSDGKLLTSPKGYGVRLELPTPELNSYQLRMLVEPLDQPNALLIGHRLQSSRFATLFGFATNAGYKSAIENIDGRNVGNETTFSGELFRTNEISQVIIEVTQKGILVLVDGKTIIHWTGKPELLSLSEYWNTPNQKSLFLGTYDCRFRFHQILLTPVGVKDDF